jgi:hypothetical protein
MGQHRRRGETEYAWHQFGQEKYDATTQHRLPAYPSIDRTGLTLGSRTSHLLDYVSGNRRERERPRTINPSFSSFTEELVGAGDIMGSLIAQGTLGKYLTFSVTFCGPVSRAAAARLRGFAL